MNKTLLSTALLTLLSTTAFADNSIQPTMPVNTAGSNATATPPPAAVAPAAKPLPMKIPAAEPSSVPAPQAELVVNCKYRITAETTTIEQSLISTWAGKAAVQSFNFNPAAIDEELAQLKLCYTDQGWQGFDEALKKSGNIEAIKSQHLTVTSQVDGELKVNPIKDNQWKVSVPLQVVYQNDKEKLTQLLSLDLLIGRKMSGDLGIMQMIATPRPAPGTQQPTTLAPTEKPAPEAATAPAVGEQPLQAPAANEKKPSAEGNQPVQTTHP